MLIPRVASNIVLTVILLAIGCTTNPETGRNQLTLLSEAKEIAIGAEAEPKFLRDYGGAIPSEPIRSYISELGRTLAHTSTRPRLPWEFHVVDSAVVNAFALPGGRPAVGGWRSCGRLAGQLGCGRVGG